MQWASFAGDDAASWSVWTARTVCSDGDFLDVSRLCGDVREEKLDGQQLLVVQGSGVLESFPG